MKRLLLSLVAAATLLFGGMAASLPNGVTPAHADDGFESSFDYELPPPNYDPTLPGAMDFLNYALVVAGAGSGVATGAILIYDTFFAPSPDFGGGGSW